MSLVGFWRKGTLSIVSRFSKAFCILILAFVSASAVCYAKAWTVHFPADRSLGMLRVQDVGAVEGSGKWWWGHFAGWEYLEEATGDVRVPEGKRLQLVVSPDGWKDLSPLGLLRPADLDSLIISCRRGSTHKGGEESMVHICRLTGLRMLILESTNVTGRGLRLMSGLKSLERLSLISDHLDDRGMAHIGELKSLKGLRFCSDKVSNAGLAHLSKLSVLEELFPEARNINYEGAAYLSKLAKLRYLLLAGKNFGDEGLAVLRGFPSLRQLEFLRPPVTETWLRNLSALKQLEDLAIRNAVLSDEDINYLRSLRSLKRLLLQGGFQQSGSALTDVGLAHLKEIKSLESLELYYGRFTDKGLEYLSELERLKCLVIPNCRSFSDAGFGNLVKLRSLEKLNIGCRGITDEGMAHIARLTGLKELMLFNARSITNEGLAEVAALKSLEKLRLHGPKITISGLNRLGGLLNLTELQARNTGYAKDIEQDKAVFDVGELTKLEKLSFAGLRDDDLVCVAKLKRLKWLEIQNGGLLSDAGIAHIAGLHSLNRLMIYDGHLTDEGLAQLNNMKKLEHLFVSGSFTDEGLRHLEGLQGLTYLRIVSENSFGSAALERLREGLANLQSFETRIRKMPVVAEQLVGVGKPLPPLEEFGIRVDTSEVKEKMVLVCFWDMHQRPSRHLVIELAKRAQELRDKDVVVVCIQASKVEKEVLDGWLKEHNIPLSVGTVEGREETLRLSWGVKSLPWLILTDRKRVVIAEGFGLDELSEKVRASAGF